MRNDSEGHQDLQDQLTESREAVARLTARVHELVIERAQLLDERRIIQVRLGAAELLREVENLA